MTTVLEQPAPIARPEAAPRTAEPGPTGAWLRRYYLSEVASYLRFLVPVGASVLEIGCQGGDRLAQLEPLRGVGLEASPSWIEAARARHPRLEFLPLTPDYAGVEGTFDVILLAHVLDFAEDIQVELERLRRFCHAGTRLICVTHNYGWAPILVLLERLGLKRTKGAYAWLSLSDLQHLFACADFEVIRKEYRTLLPVWLPGISWAINRVLGKLPGIWRLGVDQWVVARPLKLSPSVEAPSVSVVVPCRNERGTIAAIVERTPQMGRRTELIFVEGHSTDGTWEEIEAVRRRRPDRELKVLRQEGTGKGDAVRAGFAAATGDLVMILDADLSTAPEALPRFVEALVGGYGELVLGSRLVYPMPAQAMQPLNIVANMLFGRAFSFMLGHQVKDTLCGTKALWRRDYERIARQREFFGGIDPFGDFDLILGAARLSLKMLEIPVQYRERVYGTTNIRRWRHGLLLLLMWLRGLGKLKFQ